MKILFTIIFFYFLFFEKQNFSQIQIIFYLKKNIYSKYFLLLLFCQILKYILLILNKSKIDFSNYL
jgi:hypothetical protein